MLEHLYFCTVWLWAKFKIVLKWIWNRFWNKRRKKRRPHLPPPSWISARTEPRPAQWTPFPFLLPRGSALSSSPSVHSSPLFLSLTFGPRPSAFPLSLPISLPRWPHPTALSPSSRHERVGLGRDRAKPDSPDFLLIAPNQAPTKSLSRPAYPKLRFPQDLDLIGVLSAAARSHTSPRLLQPKEDRRWIRGELLASLAFFFLSLVHDFVKTKNASELQEVFNGAAVGGSPPAAGRCLEFPWRVSNRGMEIQRMKTERNLSIAFLLKRPWRFLSIEPAVPSVLRGIRKLVWKAYFGRVESKVCFHYLQVCHWISFGHKIFILTPFWPI